MVDKTISQEQAERYRDAWSVTSSQVLAYEKLMDWLMDELTKNEDHSLVNDLQEKWREIASLDHK